MNARGNIYCGACKKGYDRDRYLARNPQAGTRGPDKIQCVRGHKLEGENLVIDYHGARQCAECIKIRRHERYLANPEKHMAYHKDWLKRNSGHEKEYRAARRERSALLRLRRTYGIEIEDAKAKMEAQQWKCGICQTELKGGHIHLDHDHGTNALRDFLCADCNKMLGFARDNATKLRQGADYLERHS